MMRRKTYLTATALTVGCAGVIAAAVHFNSLQNSKKGNTAQDAKDYFKEMQPTLPGPNLEKFGKAIEFKAKNTYETLVEQALRDEFTYQDIRKDILNPIEKSVLNKKQLNIENFFDGKENVTGLPGKFGRPDRVFDGIQLFQWGRQARTGAEPQAFGKYLSQFSDVKDIRFDITSYYADMTDRSAADSSIQKMKLHGHYDIRGKANGATRNDRGPVEIVAVKKGTTWKLQSVSFGDLETLTMSREPAFKEVTEQVFADNNGPEPRLRREAIRRGGYSIALTDYNADGSLDMYVGGGGKSSLFAGDGKGGFKKVNTPEFDNEVMVKSAIFADFTNSGKQDLFVTSFNPNPGTEDLVIYENLGGDKGFKRKGDPTKGMGRLASHYPMPAAVGDFNGDGLLDVYVGFPGAKDFTFVNLTGDPKKAVQGLFTNKGNLNFSEQDMKLPTMKEGNRQTLYPHSAMAIDWDNDHNMDIVVIDDQDNLSPVYHNKGQGQFEQIAEKIGLADSANSMSIAAGDFNNDGRMDFVMTSANLLASERFDTAMKDLWARNEVTSQPQMAGKALRLFQQTPQGKFIDVTSAAGLGFAGEGGAGVEFIDYNNDGLQDIYFVNGLWSGDDRFQEASQYLVVAKNRGLTPMDLIKDRAANARSEFMDFLINFRGDLSQANFEGNHSVSAAGYQRNRLFRNNGDGTFTEVAALEGVDSINDGYIVAKGELRKDGRQDLFLRNGDPGQDSHKFPVVQIFKNNFPNDNALDLGLVAQTGNRDAIGVSVTVEVQGKKYSQQLISNNGPSQSERVLHFGLGSASKADKVTVHWQSGDQVLKDLAKGRHTLREPNAMGVVKTD